MFLHEGLLKRKTFYRHLEHYILFIYIYDTRRFSGAGIDILERCRSMKTDIAFTVKEFLSLYL